MSCSAGGPEQRTGALETANAQLRHELIEHRRTEEALFQEMERAQVTLECIGDAVITTDDAGKIEYLNPVAVQLTCWSAAEAQGQPLQHVFNIVNETTRAPVESPVARCLREGRSIGLANHSIPRMDGFSAQPRPWRDGRIGKGTAHHRPES